MSNDFHLSAGQLHAELVDDGPRRTLRLRGDLDIATVSQLRAAAASLHDGDLTLDLCRLDVVDSSGLQEIMRLRAALQPEHELRVVAVDGGLPWHLIVLAQLNELLHLQTP